MTSFFPILFFWVALLTTVHMYSVLFFFLHQKTKDIRSVLSSFPPPPTRVGGRSGRTILLKNPLKVVRMSSVTKTLMPHTPTRTVLAQPKQPYVTFEVLCWDMGWGTKKVKNTRDREVHHRFITQWEQVLSLLC